MAVNEVSGCFYWESDISADHPGWGPAEITKSAKVLNLAIILCVWERYVISCHNLPFTSFFQQLGFSAPLFCCALSGDDLRCSPQYTLFTLCVLTSIILWGTTYFSHHADSCHFTISCAFFTLDTFYRYRWLRSAVINIYICIAEWLSSK